jgi:hypothetical protein
MRCHNDMEGFGYGQGGEDLMLVPLVQHFSVFWIMG